MKNEEPREKSLEVYREPLQSLNKDKAINDARKRSARGFRQRMPGAHTEPH